MEDKPKNIARRLKSSVEQGQLLRVEIRHISTNDTELRLSRAIDILLEAATKEPEDSTNIKRRKKGSQNNLSEDIKPVARKLLRLRVIPKEFINT